VRLSMFYSTLLLTGVNLLLRLVATSFQVYISGRIGATGVGLLQLVLSVAMLAETAGIAGVRTAAMYLSAEELGRKHLGMIPKILSSCTIYSVICGGVVSAALYGRCWPNIGSMTCGLWGLCACLRLCCRWSVSAGFYGVILRLRSGLEPWRQWGLGNSFAPWPSRWQCSLPGQAATRLERVKQSFWVAAQVPAWRW
jgi:hypothetical protein